MYDVVVLIPDAPDVTVHQVSKEFVAAKSRLCVFRNLDLEVAAGEFVAILGPSGCGKSTLLRMLASLDQPTSGQILVAGGPPVDLVRSHRVGMCFQDAGLLPWRTAAQNIRLPARIAGIALDARRLNELLELVGLDGFAEAYPRQLSGGMVQRVALARALSLEPSLLLLDEPFAALDAVTRRALNLELQRLWERTASTTVLVTHMVDEAILLADRVLVLGIRPAAVLADRRVSFARPRTADLTASAEFHALADELLAYLEPARR